MDYQDIIVFLMEIIGTVAFAASGAMLGVEKKMDKGILTLKISATDQRLIIVVSDNGVGMEEDLVKDINQKLRGASLEYMKRDNKKGGIALLNVNSRIKLIFGDEYGIYIYSKLGAGTDVEITIPLIKEE